VLSVRSIDGQRTAAQGRKLFGERHGRWCHYGGSSYLVIEEHYRRGELHGPRIVFGRTRTEHMYERGERHGVSRTLRDGVVVSEGRVERGRKVGPWTEPDLLGPRATGEYVDGERAGAWTIELRDGGRMELGYRAGRWHGGVREEDAAGRLVAQRTFVDGEVDGPAILARVDGSYAFGRLVGERREGVWTFESAAGESLGEGEYRAGKRHGAWRTRTGDLWESGAWSDGRRDGEFVQADLAGRVLSREGWRDDRRDGAAEHFDRDGRRRSLQTWRDGVEHGRHGWWDAAGVVREGAYEEGRQVGPWVEPATVFGAVGHWSGVYEDGYRVGVWTFSADGVRRAEESRAADGLVLVRHWTADEVLVRSCERVAGLRHGRCATWYEDGVLQEEGRYDAGREQGVVRRWGPDGVLLEEGAWELGVRHGPRRLFHEDGTRREVATFVQGQYDGDLRQWSEVGILVHDGHYAAGQPSGVQRHFHEDGRLASRCSFDDQGDQHGRCETWFGDGVRHERSHWEHGLQVDTATTWWPSGLRRSEGAFTDGGRDGPWRYWHATGALSERGDFKAGRRVGVWTEHDRSGRLLREVIYTAGVASQVRERGGEWTDTASIVLQGSLGRSMPP